MADFIVSAVLPVLIDKLISETSRTIDRYKGIGADIKKWKKWLVQIQGALADASQKDINDDDVKEWLTDLQHLAYDVDDLLDGWATEAMDPTDSEATTSTSMVRKLIPTCCTSFSRSTRMLGELDSINRRFKDLLKRKKEFGFKGEGKSGLKVEGESRPKNINQSSSVVHPSRVVGREVERKALVQQLLLGDGPSDLNYTVVPIVGMGGIGKTTLAKLVYNDEQVSAHFELKAWVVVSDVFDSFAISKAIYGNVAEGNKSFSDLNEVQVELVKQLRGKRFLLVLDNVWCESITDWKELVEPFYTCAPGSKIVITTRKQELLKKLGYKDLSPLQRLTDNDALCLFARHALGVDNFDSHLSLKPHGEDIIKKCDGLPLALIALGASLMTKEDEDSWRGVVNSEIWTSEDCDVKKIIPALRLSYLDLSAHLKQLFAYCSLFPKDFLFNKEELVQLWMAEGFLTQLTPNNSTEERLGLTSFDELLSRTFFQHAPDFKSLFVMHDMMNDLAKFVAGEFFLRFDSESENGIKEETWEKCRHMSFVPETYVTKKKFKTFEKAKSLRTFLVSSLPGYKRFYLSDKIFAAVLPKLPLLRVLHLSNFSISEVPESIGTLRHLRYLNLSHTQITHLPENVCTLYNLQTLILSGCYSLIELPKSFLKLKNLRHFDISGTRILKMPFGIGELKSLQTLPKIIIGGENGFEIAKLKDLEKLCGKISIVNLDEVQDAKHAQEANFSQKVVSELEVEWSHDSRDKGLGKEVLNQLKPRSDKLIQLKIKSYRGLAFPSWVGDPSFLLLKHVSINGCSECASLPPLGQLPSLKELFIEKLDRVKVVGMEFFGAGLSFPSLKILCFKNMLGWEKWSTNGEAMFPCLQELKLNSCNKLVDVSLGALPSLNVLEIDNCDSGVLRSLVQVTKAVIKLEMESISGLNDVVWRGVMEHVGEVEELSIMGCNEIRYLWELKAEALASKVLVKLRKLVVCRCDNLISLGEKEEEEDNRRSNLLTSLMVLDVQSCNKMECLSCPESIETLEVYYCSSITTISLPTRVQKLKSFKVMGCKKLLEREWGRQNMNNNRIEVVCITKWSNLKSIELTYLDHLTVLSIVNCKNLETFPDNALANLTSLKDLDIINCPRMDDCGVWPPNLHSLKIGKLKKPISKWSTQNFPTSLVSLELYGFKDEVSSCSQFSDLLPLSLTSLGINGFEKLESIKEGLQHLTSLQQLSVSECPNLKNLSYPQQLQHIFFYECPEMMDLPQDLLPSLLGLRIGNGCPKLKERCSEGGIYSSHISYIPFISISSRATHSGEATNKIRSLWAVALRRAQL